MYITYIKLCDYIDFSMICVKTFFVWPIFDLTFKCDILCFPWCSNQRCSQKLGPS